MDFSTQLAREMGKLPDIFWYQLNGKSAQENYNDQKNRKHKKEKEEKDFIQRFLEGMLKAQMEALIKAAMDDIFPDDFPGKKK